MVHNAGPSSVRIVLGVDRPRCGGAERKGKTSNAQTIIKSIKHRSLGIEIGLRAEIALV